MAGFSTSTGRPVWKLESLDDRAAARAMVPWEQLLGMVNTGYVERWGSAGVGRSGGTYPWTDENPDADWRVELTETTAEILALYNGECDRSREIVAAASSLDEIAKHPRRELNRRWILVHMIEETARHNGHADILREQLDGTVGE